MPTTNQANKLQARNEMVINAAVSNIWSVITDVSQLHLVNPAVIKATGTMNTLNGTRTCEIKSKGKTAVMTERLIEMEPEKRTVWTIESDNMGMGKVLKNSRFCFHLQKIGDRQTKVISETWYQPANFIARVMNILMVKRMISNAQQQMLPNLKIVTEKPA